jgi:hypothetical protein
MYIPRLAAADRISMTLGPINVGLLVYDLDSLTIMHWNGTAWNKLGGGGSGGSLATETVTEYYTISATSFISYDTDANTYVAEKANNGGILYLKSSGEAFAGSGVHLPDGAKITTVTLFSKDRIAFGDNIIAELLSMEPLVSTTPGNIAVVTSSDAVAGNVVSEVNITSVVDNSKYLYWIQLKASGAQGTTQNLGTYGVKITYTIERVK